MRTHRGLVDARSERRGSVDVTIACRPAHNLATVGSARVAQALSQSAYDFQTTPRGDLPL